MKEFRETISGFRDAMRQEGERSVSPSLQLLLQREHSARGFRLRWAVATAAVLLTLGAIPVYQNEQKSRAAAQERADMLLFEQVNDSLSRSISPVMEPLLDLEPGN